MFRYFQLGRTLLAFKTLHCHSHVSGKPSYIFQAAFLSLPPNGRDLNLSHALGKSGRVLPHDCFRRGLYEGLTRRCHKGLLMTNMTRPCCQFFSTVVACSCLASVGYGKQSLNVRIWPVSASKQEVSDASVIRGIATPMHTLLGLFVPQ